MNWLYAIYGFALIGAGVVAYWIVCGSMKVYRIVDDLSKALREAVEITKVFRSDLSIIRQITQADGPTQPVYSSAGSEQPNPPEAPAVFPVPFAGLYRREPEKPPEPEAPYEKPDAVDVTASDDEVIDADRIDNLRRMGIPVVLNEEPEPGRTVEAE